MCGKKEILIVIFVLIAIVISVQTYGFGFAPSYLENNTLYINQGKRADYSIQIQNSEDQRVVVMVELLGEYAKIKDTLENTTNVTVKARTSDTTITFEINPPPNARIGQKYEIWYRLTPMIEKDGGMVPFTMRLNKQFNVTIVKQGGVGTEATTASPIHFEIRKFFNNLTTKYSGVFDWAKGIGIAILIILVLVIGIIVLVGLWKRSWKMASRIGGYEPVRYDQARYVPERAVRTYEPSYEQSAIWHHGLEHRNKDIPKPKQLITAKKAFVFRNKKKVKNLKELYTTIYSLDHNTFAYHVHKYRNDISKWVEEELNDERLALELSKYITKDHFIKILAVEVEKIEYAKKIENKKNKKDEEKTANDEKGKEKKKGFLGMFGKKKEEKEQLKDKKSSKEGKEQVNKNKFWIFGGNNKKGKESKNKDKKSSKKDKKKR